MFRFLAFVMLIAVTAVIFGLVPAKRPATPTAGELGQTTRRVADQTKHAAEEFVSGIKGEVVR